MAIYEGEEKFSMAHGHGKSVFANGNIYIGEHHLDKPDGYGVMLMNMSFHMGFFSNGLPHGLGTYSDGLETLRGQWRLGMRHGKFIRTKNFTTTCEWWYKNLLMEVRDSVYIPHEQLLVKPKLPVRRKIFKPGKFDHLCFICVENTVNCTNSACGHCFACDECFKQCQNCPICRAPIEKIIKLFC